MSGNLTELLKLFGIVTVMNVHVYTLKEGKYGTKKLSPENFINTGICLDTLKISNIKQNSPKKTFSVGMLNMPLIQIGKNITIEIQDALCHRDVLEYFCGVELIKNFDKTGVSVVDGFVIGNNFSSPICLEGSTCIVDLNGNKQDLWITIPCFFPKNALNLNFEAEGQAGTFDLNGEVYPVVWGSENKLHYVIVSTQQILNEVT